ncbi:hypothetical protein A3E13_01945 [Candidatus Woesebacteria bacterium RIFCSPHIGHO2_12_FULL_40_20]|nr:MAG: hypothetical protein A3E13_01945 [Candidatus Woesebacteria bacterium RIFCSPHIGHO2_12_FULL_40_20]
MDDKELLDRANDVLLANLFEVRLNGSVYRRTVPSKEFYVHQWNWDSATHAMGLVYVDEQRAFDELFSLCAGQWENGLIAQITFNPNETKYFPGPQFWGTGKFANGEIITSGITQPPLLGISFAHIYVSTKNSVIKKRLIEEILPKVIKYHEYLKKYRDPENGGLLTVVHPWESGTDNSPRWDNSLSKIRLEDIPDDVKIIVNKYRSDDKVGDPKHRPGLDDYYKYMYLVWLFSSWKWDYEVIVKKSPFAVKDILFNSLWCRANELLAEILDGINDPQAEKFRNWSVRTRTALQNCWDEKLISYKDIDVSLGNHDFVEENTISNFLPLWAGAPKEPELELLLNKLEDPKQYWPKVPIPTTSLDSPKFSLTRYWRGPTWPITNLFVIEGLARYVANERAKRMHRSLIDKTLEMIKKNGFYEYFDPTSGVARPDKKDTFALGFGTFSWTAAVSIYLLHKYN